jgi:hypothetical protein
VSSEQLLELAARGSYDTDTCPVFVVKRSADV